MTNELNNAFNKIIRGYDIRGVFGKDLTPDLIEKIGEAFGSEWNGKKIVIGMDNRPHSKEVLDSFLRGLQLFDVEIFDCGLTTSPVISFIAKEKDCFGVMITASHNNISYNGIKLCKPNIQSYDGVEIKNIVLKRFSSDNSAKYKNNTIVIQKLDANSLYINFLLGKFCVQSSKKIAWNFMNAGINSFSKQYLSKLNIKNFIINDDILNLKENPDPMFKDNIHEMSDFVLNTQCDFGFSFDGDADRVVVFDDLGRQVQSEHLMMIFARELNFFGENVICDVKSSHKLKKFLEKINCTVIISRIGHSFMKKKIQETQALMSGEVSGHYIFRDLGFDDGFYTAMVFLQILQHFNLNLSEIIDSLPKIYCSENIKIYMSRENIQLIIEKILNYANNNLLVFDIIDGVKILNNDGWVLFRGSNTEDCLTIGFEAFEGCNYKKISEWKDFLLNL